MNDFLSIEDRKVLASKYANRFHLETSLVCAVIEQESAWNTFALRSESESGFKERYGEAYHKIVLASASKYDDRWIQFEDIFYASYGLMQTMYPVVIEMIPVLANGLRFPTELCDPATGLLAGCEILSAKLDAAGGNTRLALLRWNGGGDTEYPEKVIARASKYY